MLLNITALSAIAASFWLSPTSIDIAAPKSPPISLFAQADSEDEVPTNGWITRFAQIRPTFVRAWKTDSCAQGEPINDYVDHWIHNFYFGGNGTGWFSISDAIVNKLPAGHTGRVLSKRLNDLGQRIAIEWAKPNDCRRITTFGGPPSLAYYSSMLRPFLQDQATIDVSELTTTLTAIDKSIDTALH